MDDGPKPKPDEAVRGEHEGYVIDFRACTVRSIRAGKAILPVGAVS